MSAQTTSTDARSRPITGRVRTELHREYARTRDGDLKRAIVEAHRGLAQSLARRIGSRGGDCLDDLVQVAYLALVKAVDRFDPDMGFQFSTYATGVISGELKRHLRDRTWSVRPPRPVHDLYLATEAAVDELTQTLRRSPTIPELADSVGASEDDVVHAMEAGDHRRATSLDRPLGPDGATLTDLVDTNEEGFGRLEGRLLLEALLPRLDQQARVVLDLRFRENLSQVEIARRLGMSQMYVSRTLRRTLERLRAAVEEA